MEEPIDRIIPDRIIEGVYKELREKWKNTPLSLMSGKPGICLFVFYYSRLKDSKEIAEFAVEILDDIIAQAGSSKAATYANGLMGIAWLVDHLHRNHFIDIEVDAILGEVDEYLSSWVMNELERDNFDFLHGGGGGIFYFLNKGSKYHPLLSDILNLLYKKAIVLKESNMFIWKGFDIMENKVATMYNLGLSHGMASIMIFLVEIGKKDIQVQLVKEMLNGLIEFYKYCELDPDINNCYFGSFTNLNEKNDEVMPSRFAWCYGDLGICVALWKTAVFLEDKELKKRTKMIMYYNSTRKSMTSNHICDGCVCHGTAGIAAIFDFFFQETGEVLFKETAIYWFKKTVEFSRFDSISGFESFSIISQKWSENLGLLEGTAGIGLSLIGALDPNNHWNEAILL